MEINAHATRNKLVEYSLFAEKGYLGFDIIQIALYYIGLYFSGPSSAHFERGISMQKNILGSPARYNI